jgi:hypothetical protein
MTPVNSSVRFLNSFERSDNIYCLIFTFITLHCTFVFICFSEYAAISSQTLAELCIEKELFSVSSEISF